MARKIISSVLTFILVVTLSLGVATARSPQAGSTAAGSGSANVTVHGPGTGPANLKQYMAKFQSLIPDPGDFTPKQIRHAARQAAIGMPDVDPQAIKVKITVRCCPLEIIVDIQF